MRASRTSGSRSGTWKRSRAALVRHRQTKGPATDRRHLNHRATSRLYPMRPDGPCTSRTSTAEPQGDRKHTGMVTGATKKVQVVSQKVSGPVCPRPVDTPICFVDDSRRSMDRGAGSSAWWPASGRMSSGLQPGAVREWSIPIAVHRATDADSSDIIAFDGAKVPG